jgi:hypothetical protein
VGYQHNIPYNLKAQPAFNHHTILPAFFANNWYTINSQQQANKLNYNLPLMLKTANTFHMNFASTTKFSSIMTLENHIWVHSLSLHKVLTILLMHNNSQSMVVFSCSDHQLLLSTSTFADCCHFLNVTIEDTNVIPKSL